MPAADREQYEPEIPSPSRTEPAQPRRKVPDGRALIEHILGQQVDRSALAVFAVAAGLLALYALQVLTVGTWE